MWARHGADFGSSRPNGLLAPVPAEPRSSRASGDSALPQPLRRGIRPNLISPKSNGVPHIASDEDNGGSAKPDGYVAERHCCSENLDGSHAVVPPPVQEHQHDRNAGGDQGAVLGGRLDDAAGRPTVIRSRRPIGSTTTRPRGELLRGRSGRCLVALRPAILAFASPSCGVSRVGGNAAAGRPSRRWALDGLGRQPVSGPAVRSGLSASILPNRQTARQQWSTTALFRACRGVPVRRSSR